MSAQDGSARIEQVIYVSRETHRPIVLGNGGQRIKTIGAASRLELVLPCLSLLTSLIKHQPAEGNAGDADAQLEKIQLALIVAKLSGHGGRRECR